MRWRPPPGPAAVFRRWLRQASGWRRRDPPPWVIALIGMGCGLALFVLALLLVALSRLPAAVGLVR